ncbi:hypothetical protein Dda_8257 [Drechslerella dactyloides]|uniref:Uncharacterized protein n=1 Tax=Drechslerella dactyloides TaxID=74499 RepID=A0AAD6IRX1_DREDA|nr:hypothetical protein Dda_8257 [Drechslerella dactyloides]
MSLFTTLTTLAASTLVDSYKQPRPQPQQQFTASRVTVEEIETEEEPAPPPLPSRRRLPQLALGPPYPPRAAPMQPAGLPQNSIWSTVRIPPPPFSPYNMSYPIPRGPCLQKSSLISACSCQRFMVHPLKATSSFDCDGCGHHASFHRMKSHEEEVEQAARVRDAMAEVHSREVRLRTITGVEDAASLNVEIEDDDLTLDDVEEEVHTRRKKRRVVKRAGSEASEGGSGRALTGTRRGKRNRAGEAVVLE